MGKKKKSKDKNAEFAELVLKCEELERKRDALEEESAKLDTGNTLSEREILTYKMKLKNTSMLQGGGGLGLDVCHLLSGVRLDGLYHLWARGEGVSEC